MNIETSNEGEFLDLLKVFNEARKSAAGLMTQKASLSELRAQMKGEKIFSAKINGEIAGFVSVWEQDNFIHHLYVAPEHQGQGIGKALLRECRNKLGLPLSLKCVEENQKACAFYERNGWVAKVKEIGPEGPYIIYWLYDT